MDYLYNDNESIVCYSGINSIERKSAYVGINSNGQMRKVQIVDFWIVP